MSPPDAAEPWFAMELVDGMRLTDHAEARRLTIHDRLVLLAATCDAVAHAHSRGIVTPNNEVGLPAPSRVTWTIAPAPGQKRVR